jgi:hypothetical protein
MHSESFHAATTYGDLQGSAAADDADVNHPNRWLSQHGHIQDGEHLVGIKMHIVENHGKHEDPVQVNFLLAPSDQAMRRIYVPGGDEVPIVVRSVTVDMPLNEFFGLFKRFEICISSGGSFEGRSYTYPNY